MIQATRHTGIVVRDMEKSLCFWRDVMGLTVVADFWEEGEFIDTVQHLRGVKLHMIKLTAPDGTLIELLQDEKHPTEPPASNQLCDHGIRHVAFTVSDIEDAWRVLHEAGCETLSRPVIDLGKTSRLFFARDPEGNLIELVQELGNPA